MRYGELIAECVATVVFSALILLSPVLGMATDAQGDPGYRHPVHDLRDGPPRASALSPAGTVRPRHLQGVAAVVRSHRWNRWTWLGASIVACGAMAW
jgi:hypothetical protein